MYYMDYDPSIILFRNKGMYLFLFRFVSEKMGGSIEKGQVANFSWELPLSQIKFELKSNVIPIGKIKTGIYIHRALLFKVSNIGSDEGNASCYSC